MVQLQKRDAVPERVQGNDPAVVEGSVGRPGEAEQLPGVKTGQKAPEHEGCDLLIGQGRHARDLLSGNRGDLVGKEQASVRRESAQYRGRRVGLNAVVPRINKEHGDVLRKQTIVIDM